MMASFSVVVVALATLTVSVSSVPVRSRGSSPMNLPVDGASPEKLRFSADGKFRIVQVADVHFGEGPESWGPIQDAISIKYIKELMGYAGADLVVLSGDQLTAKDIDKNATAYWDIVVDALGATPHTAILGNHDAEPPHANGHNQSSPGAHTNRVQLMAHDVTTRLSHSQLGPAHLNPAVSVYIVDVWNADPGELTPELQLVHLDSGGGGMIEELFPPQITWLNRTLEKRRQQFGRAIPSLVFVHIPMWEFKDAMKHGSECVGEQDEKVAPTLHNTGLFAAIEANPEIVGVFVGHNHCNDFCCKIGRRAVDLCFGRHSGRGGYNCDGYENGARVIDVEINPWKASTHIRLTNGSITHEAGL